MLEAELSRKTSCLARRQHQEREGAQGRRRDIFSAARFCEVTSWQSPDELRGVESERSGWEEILKGPAASQVDTDATSRLADACTYFEQLRAQGFDLCRSQRGRQLQTKQVDQVVSETVPQEPKGIGSETMTTESVSGKAVLELFNTVLTFPAILIEGKNRTAATLLVGHQKT